MEKLPTLFLPREPEPNATGKIHAQVITVLGDTHGRWEALHWLINNQYHRNPIIRAWAEEYDLEIIILQVGDFGFYWPHMENKGRIQNEAPYAKDGRIKIYWCAGNHEHWGKLGQMEKKEPEKEFFEVDEGIYYARFGAVLTLVNGLRVMFAGGAESIDKAMRTPYVDWWPQEGISTQDMARLPEGGRENKVHWVVSHTAPMGFQLIGAFFKEKKWEPSRKKLELIRRAMGPWRWFFGHFHMITTGKIDGCEWVGLAHTGHQTDDWFYQV